MSGPNGDLGVPVEAGAEGEDDGFGEAGCLDPQWPRKAHLWMPRLPAAVTGLLGGIVPVGFSHTWPLALRGLVTPWGTSCPALQAAAPAVPIMARGLLWLGLTLLGALQTQAQDSAPNWIPAPPLLRVPLQPDFQDDQFQGKWYVVGLAGNAVKKEEQGQFKMYTTTYQLKDDHSYNVTSTLLRDQGCDHWIRTFVPSFQPGQFNLGNIKRYPGVHSYTVRVAATNYNQFAIVFFKKVYKNQEYFKTTLYGRTKELTPERKEEFIRFAKSLGLTDDHIIFPVPIDQCIDEQ